jgi:hypothetical protein
VRSSTAIDFTLLGIALKNASAANGRNNRTFNKGLPQNVHSFFRGACTGPHQDHAALGIRWTVVVEQPGLLHETVHHVLHNCGASAVERVADLRAVVDEKFVRQHHERAIGAIMFTSCEVAEAVKEG